MKTSMILMALVFMLLAMVSVGCGTKSQNPSTPDLPDSTVSSHDSWGAYDMIIDKENMMVEIVPNRDSMMHFNINPYMSLCTGGCFRFRIVGIVGTVLEIEMTLQNPVKLVGYDVRITFTALNGKTVMNPDSYTDVFDPPSTPAYFNPFIEFTQTDPARKFNQSPFSDKQTLFIDFPSGASAAVTWVIDASYPGNSEEPYEINSMNYSGNLTPSGGTGTVSCKVLDHQNDVSYVHVNTTPITGGWTLLNPIGSDTFEKEITNSMGAPAGDYVCLIKAESLNPLQASTYNYVTITVNDDTGPCDGSMNLFVFSDGNWVVDGTIDVDGYSGLQFMTNLLDYTPSGPASNYHTVYYWGGKGGSFRNGMTWELSDLATSLGYTFRKQETGDLDLSDVRIMFWPAIGSDSTAEAPSDTEIAAMKNLLAQGGRIIITNEYDLGTAQNIWVSTQLSRLGSSIYKPDGLNSTNVGVIPQDCPAFSHDVSSVMFRAWGFLETSGDAFTLFYDPYQQRPIGMGEVLP